MRDKKGRFIKGVVPTNKGKRGTNWILKKCLTCNKDFWGYICSSRPGRGLFCCRQCRTIYQQGKRVLPESYKHSFETKLRIGKASLGRHLSEASKKKISDKNKGENNGMYGKTHSDEYKKILSAKRGEQTPNWKGGITKENKLIRTCAPYATWRKTIFERDNYTCQICHERGGKLRAHHIKRFSDYLELRLKTENGITICTVCDYEFVFNREKQWETYFLNILNLKQAVSHLLYERPYSSSKK